MAENYNQRWPVIQDILRREGIARQHLTSFDEFLGPWFTKYNSRSRTN